MKWHRHLVNQLVESLEDTFGESDYHADKVLHWRFKNNRKWGSRDRKFFAESFYEIVRNWRSSVETAGFNWSDDIQLRPDDYEKVFAAWAATNFEDLPNWDVFSTEAVENFKNNKKKLTEISSTQSIPDWMQSIGKKTFGDDWGPLVEALNKPATFFLRANQLKADVDALVNRLKSEGLMVKKVENDCIQVIERKNVFALKSFKDGFFEVQDSGSQKISPFLEVEPGMRVLDACAGAGGKSLHIAALMKNRGKVISTDIHQWKLDELRKRSRRAGVDIIETKVITNKLIKRWQGSFDRLLLDVPCSGIGVLKRNPDTKWKLSLERITELTEIQAEILHSYSRVVKTGGKMVYATCSVLPQENQQQVHNFLAQNKDWALEQECSLSPVDADSDGFYMARLVRNH